MVYRRLCEKLRGNAKRYGGGRLGRAARFLSLSLFSSCRTSHPSHRPHQLRRSLTLSRPRVAAVGVASKLGQSLVAVASRFGDSKEGRKEGRKKGRKEGRKEGKEEGSFLFPFLSFHQSVFFFFFPFFFLNLSLPRPVLLSSSSFSVVESSRFSGQTSLEFWPRFFPTTNRTHRFRTVRKSRYPGFGACKRFSKLSGQAGEWRGEGRGETERALREIFENYRSKVNRTSSLSLVDGTRMALRSVGWRRRMYPPCLCRPVVLSTDVKVGFVPFRFGRVATRR